MRSQQQCKRRKNCGCSVEKSGSTSEISRFTGVEDAIASSLLTHRSPEFPPPNESSPAKNSNRLNYKNLLKTLSLQAQAGEDKEEFFFATVWIGFGTPGMENPINSVFPGEICLFPRLVIQLILNSKVTVTFWSHLLMTLKMETYPTL
ncbi:hypothetical protein H6F78_10530 [Coleofasciculus sp. FACHB-64]|uniref:hypothetical protein n=1 Tax=Cyanophyceae TaxID=3028117 RepID=UPI0016826475|nr:MULTISPECIES: hypothetical protein [unclassified Coleofasciculus]MBD1840900.1 hypothetical protein [Coleofasciculus sp. FACHB-501]MBD2046025.1 hypothetical protein [Coleofasciculus sp. FACHB-64]